MRNRFILLGFLLIILFGCHYSKEQSTGLLLKNERFVVELGNSYPKELEFYLNMDNLSDENKRNLLQNGILVINGVLNNNEDAIVSVGEYKGTISYFEEKVTFTLVVEDTTKPAATILPITIELNSSGIDYAQYITIEDLSETTLIVDDTVDYTKAGQYEVNAIVRDAWGNATEESFQVEVVDKAVAYDSNKENIGSASNEVTKPSENNGSASKPSNVITTGSSSSSGTSSLSGSQSGNNSQNSGNSSVGSSTGNSVNTGSAGSLSSGDSESSSSKNTEEDSDSSENTTPPPAACPGGFNPSRECKSPVPDYNKDMYDNSVKLFAIKSEANNWATSQWLDKSSPYHETNGYYIHPILLNDGTYIYGIQFYW